MEIDPEDDNLDFVTSCLSIPAGIFLSIIYIIMVPLIFSSIVVAVTFLGATKKLKTFGLGVGTYFSITTIAILVAIFLVSIISPGNILDITLLKESFDLSDDDVEIKDSFELDDIPSAISNIIPRNPITSHLEGQMQSILVFVLIVGLTIGTLPKKSTKPVLNLLESIQKITI